MKGTALTVALAGGILATGAAPAQPVREAVDGLQRICSYPGQNLTLSGTSAERQYRVGLGQNCPESYPVDHANSLAMPPTARLAAERPMERSRECSYEQGGATWLRYLPLTQRCPMAAGMLPASAATQAPTGAR